MKYNFLNKRHYFEMGEDTPFITFIVGVVLVIILIIIAMFSGTSNTINEFNNGKTFKCFNDNYYIEVNKSNSKIDNGYIHYIDGKKHYLFPFCKCVIKNVL